MKTKTTLALVIGFAATAGITMLEKNAEACGGCFHPPEETPTIITDHRMLLSVSQDQTTLWDQIKYSGTPTSFAWVLPIAGTVDIGLSADIVFGSFDSATQTQIISPPQNCPAPPADCANRNSAFGGSSSGSSGSGGAAAPPEADDAGVSVLKQQVVGPYETVQLSSTDPQALSNWLSSHGYSVPADVQPTVDQYVAQSFNFLALKLVPGAGVQDMRPVRVTTKGASVTLPLRMVSAGTGATVGITLWVVSEGRYEPQNYPFFHIDTNDIVWDWNQERSNYTELRAAKSTDGKSWEIESSIALAQSILQGPIYEGYAPGSTASGAEQVAQQDYAPVTNPDGSVAQTAVQVRDTDFATIFHGIGSVARVTRMRADVAHDQLKTADLVLAASADQSELSNVRQLTKEANQPMCPVYDGCDVVGQAPRDQAAAQMQGATGSGAESFSCSTGRSNGDSTWIGLGGAFFALAVGKAARARRKR